MKQKKATNKCTGCKHYDAKADTCDMKKEGIPVITNPNNYFKRCSNWK